jgi:glycosyltransferase involved in cell wall biosynthesis
MKIFYINNNPKGKGTYWRCLWLARGLVKQGHQVTIFCLQDRKSLKISTEVIDKVKVIALPRFSNSGLKELPGHILRVIYIFFVLLFSNIDVLHTFNVASLTCGLSVFPLWFVRKLGLKRFKIIVDWDDLWGKEGLTHLSNQGFVTEHVADFLETRVPLLADRVTVVSSDLKRRAVKAGVNPDKIIKIINGADVDRVKPIRKSLARKKIGLLPEERVISFPGTMTINLKMVLDAFDIIAARIKNSKLILINPLGEKERTLISQSGYTDKIISLGFLPYDKYLLYLAASDVVLIPRSNHILDRCEFPARLGDALALGRVVVTNRSGEPWRILKDNKAGLVAEVDDYRDFAAKIMKILSNEDFASELSTRARMIAEKKYSWNNLSRKLLREVYD